MNDSFEHFHCSLCDSVTRESDYDNPAHYKVLKEEKICEGCKRIQGEASAKEKGMAINWQDLKDCAFTVEELSLLRMGIVSTPDFWKPSSSGGMNEPKDDKISKLLGKLDKFAGDVV